MGTSKSRWHMYRRVVLAAVLALALEAMQAQTFSRGIPAGATSPEPDGRQHGIPASVVSPTPLPAGVHAPVRPPNVRVHGPLRRFGTPGHRARPLFVPVPVFYSYYTDGAYPSVIDPTTPDTASAAPADPAQAQPAGSDEQADALAVGEKSRSEDELRAAYLQGARDALRDQQSRYGQHSFDSGDRQQPAPARERARHSDEMGPPAPTQEKKAPPTVFIFKDGHQLETRNYAIMGETLYDLSGSAPKKIQLSEIDSAATVKANDDRGVQVKLQ
jgi:hypothetical protein